MTWQLLVRNVRVPQQITATLERLRDEESFEGVRCPRCSWRPSSANLWSCFCDGRGPEPYFQGCGISWNTFSTRGLCPGCGHQWQWTICLRCGEWSLHEDWYEGRKGA